MRPLNSRVSDRFFDLEVIRYFCLGGFKGIIDVFFATRNAE
jgi:hypothetical protein